ncbi:MAG: NADH-quinone oxidoreductase subunit L, partial [Myxococcota bacterium]
METGPIHPSSLLGLIILLPLIGAIINGVFGKRMGRSTVSLVGVGSVLLAFVLSAIEVYRLTTLPDDHVISATFWTWFQSGELNINVAFLLDHLSAVMLMIVTGVGTLIHVFSTGYMKGDPGYWKYFAYLNLFMFSMLLLILGQNLMILFVGWEGVGLCSYLLIGFWFTDMQKAEAGQKAFITNRVGDLAFLIGAFILLYYTGGDLSFIGADSTVGAIQETAAYLPTQPGGEGVMTLVALLFFVGVTGKSAQIPLYVWLADAMAGPTPVSALIHAATMVTAGVYLMARMNYVFVVSETAMTVIAVIG